jgi:MOSC domain-containing protein YiiM
VSARLVSVNVASQLFEFDGERSGIDKRPVSGPVRIFDHQVEGDQVLDRVHHGGPDKAVYSYASEDALWWAERIGGEVPAGRFGENLTTAGLDVSGAVIGEIWRVGTATLQVCQPRIPCNTFARFWERKGLVAEFTREARPGAYLRILEEGRVQEGVAIDLLDRPAHGVTIAQAFRARTGTRELVPLLLDAAQLPDRWHEWAAGILGTADGTDA